MDGEKKCPCRYKSCKRHGDCDACREHHRTVKRMPPACERKKKPGRKAELEKE